MTSQTLSSGASLIDWHTETPCQRPCAPPEELPYTLCASRSQPRLKTGEVAFECQYGTEAPVKVPLTAFFDAEGWCTDFEVCEAINNWCDKAYRYPETKRKCITCNCKATKGFVLCGKCDKVMGQMIYSQ
jgi:hypothetical protein